jgi:hypothetical protein
MRPFCSSRWPQFLEISSLICAGDMAGKRIEFDERLSGYELDDHTLSPIDSVALIAMRPPKPRQKGQVLDPSWTLEALFQAPTATVL